MIVFSSVWQFIECVDIFRRDTNHCVLFVGIFFRSEHCPSDPHYWADDISTAVVYPEYTVGLHVLWPWLPRGQGTGSKDHWTGQGHWKSHILVPTGSSNNVLFFKFCFLANIVILISLTSAVNISKVSLNVRNWRHNQELLQTTNMKVKCIVRPYKLNNLVCFVVITNLLLTINCSYGLYGIYGLIDWLPVWMGGLVTHSITYWMGGLVIHSITYWMGGLVIHSITYWMGGLVIHSITYWMGGLVIHSITYWMGGLVIHYNILNGWSCYTQYNILNGWSCYTQYNILNGWSCYVQYNIEWVVLLYTV